LFAITEYSTEIDNVLELDNLFENMIKNSIPLCDQISLEFFYWLYENFIFPKNDLKNKEKVKEFFKDIVRKGNFTFVDITNHKIKIFFKSIKECLYIENCMNLAQEKELIENKNKKDVFFNELKKI
jgi:hypothetical protein